jgi:hypothetical protein
MFTDVSKDLFYLQGSFSAKIVSSMMATANPTMSFTVK